MKDKIIKTLIVTVVFGLLTAFVGTFFAISFLMPGGIFVKNVDVESQNQEFLKTSLGIKAYGRLEVFEFLDKTLPAVAGIYKKKSASSLIDRMYLDKDRLGYGFVLTSDGWVVTNKKTVEGWGVAGLKVAVGDQLYTVTNKVYDTWTDTAFLKIEASGLSVTSLGNSETLQLGDIVFTGTDRNNFWFSYVTAINFYPEQLKKVDAVLSSERFGKIIRTQDEFPSEFNGGMVANRNGEVVGIIVSANKENYILPINYFKNVINNVLKNKKVARPYFGVNYIDLGAALAETLPNSKGAYIYGGGLLRSVAFGSPAARAGLRTGDTILEIDGENVTELKNLAEIISEYQSGNEITLKVLRAGEEKEIKVTLGQK